MNLIIIGKNVNDIALKLQKMRPKFAVLDGITSLKNTDLKKYLQEHKAIMIIDTNVILSYGINNVLNFCQEVGAGVTLIADSFDNTDEDIIFYTIARHFPETTLLWSRNEENEGYDEMMERSVGVLDYTISAPN